MVYLNRQKKSMWQHLCAWALTLALGMNLLPAAVLRQALADDGGDQPGQGLVVKNPRIELDESMQESGQLVTWDCIWFGSYPQTEVTVEELPALESAGWNENGDATIEGVKYRRISEFDATNPFNWGDAGEYRYFRYEPIKWRVLNVDNEKGTAFCLADEGLDCQRYNQDWAEVTWETSTIRAWLNGSSADPNQAQDTSSKSFINRAFTTDEKAAILKTSVVNKNNLNPDWNTSGGNDTEDHIFLLSESEVHGDSAVGNATSYGFSANPDTLDEARRCSATAFAHAMGAWTDGDSCCEWWLRSPGDCAD